MLSCVRCLLVKEVHHDYSLLLCCWNFRLKIYKNSFIYYAWKGICKCENPSKCKILLLKWYKWLVRTEYWGLHPGYPFTSGLYGAVCLLEIYSYGRNKFATNMYYVLDAVASAIENILSHFWVKLLPSF